MSRDPHSHEEIEFCRLAIQYHVAARFSLAAELVPINGNLFHHAIENGLKALLVRRYTLSELAQRPFGHRLPRLWTEFKSEASRVARGEFDGFDDVMAQLDRFEDLRYPDSIVKNG